MSNLSNTNDLAHAKNVDHEEIINRYTSWAKKDEGSYDRMGQNYYRGPQYLADQMAKLFPDEACRKSVRVLDVAAGTGFVGEKLSAIGFESKNIDALEPSEGMVEILRSKNFYNDVFLTSLADKKIDVKDDSYDVLTVCGGMGENHIPCSGLTEMVRLVRPGGFIVIIMREAYLTTVDEYKDRLEPLMKELEERRTWTIVSRTVMPKYSFQNNGVLFTFRVL